MARLVREKNREAKAGAPAVRLSCIRSFVPGSSDSILFIATGSKALLLCLLLFFGPLRPPDILRVSSDTPRRRKASQECDQPVRSAHAGAMGRVLEEFAPGEDLGVETPW